jgi:multicomponent Na+:H+ antiporter subunit G
MHIVQVLGSLLFLVGAFFVFVGALGVLRMPDVYNKLQAGTKATTLGFVSLALGLLCFQPAWTLKILLIAFFVLVTNPIGSHALARAAKNTGVPIDGAGRSSGAVKGEVQE